MDTERLSKINCLMKLFGFDEMRAEYDYRFRVNAPPKYWETPYILFTDLPETTCRHFVSMDALEAEVHRIFKDEIPV